MEIYEREVEIILDKLSDDVNDFKDCIEREYRYDHELHRHGDDNVAGPDIALRVVAGVAGTIIAGAIVAPSLVIGRHPRRRPDKGIGQAQQRSLSSPSLKDDLDLEESMGAQDSEPGPLPPTWGEVHHDDSSSEATRQEMAAKCHNVVSYSKTKIHVKQHNRQPVSCELVLEQGDRQEEYDSTDQDQVKTSSQFSFADLESGEDEEVSVIGHGILAGNHFAKCRDSPSSQSLMCEDDGQSSL
jgi:hypothetical protein